MLQWEFKKKAMQIGEALSQTIQKVRVTGSLPHYKLMYSDFVTNFAHILIELKCLATIYTLN